MNESEWNMDIWMDEWNNKKYTQVKKVSPQVKQLHWTTKIINRSLWYNTEKKIFFFET